LKNCEVLMWQAIAEGFEWQCPNISGYILDFVELPECKGFNLKTLNGRATIKVIGLNKNRRQERFFDLEISEEMPGRWKYS
jgi:hypothetical protein